MVIDVLKQYRTIGGFGSHELEINKSRFIAYVIRAESEEEAQAFIVGIKKKHWDATHNCSAYVLGESDQVQKTDDDGEPSGTAGRPILEAIKKAQVKDAAIVVTRYFGGIKLGAGGLIRAYGKSAVAGLKAAGLIERKLHSILAAEFDYTFLGKVENELRSNQYIIDSINYTDKVIVNVLAECGSEYLLEQKLLDWTAGQAGITHTGRKYVDMPVDF